MLSFDALVGLHEPHCIAWAQAEASLWGINKDHDLDEPIRLSETIPCRLRYANHHGLIVIDRSLAWRDLKCGRDVQVRFYFKSGRHWVWLEWVHYELVEGWGWGSDASWQYARYDVGERAQAQFDTEPRYYSKPGDTFMTPPDRSKCGMLSMDGPTPCHYPHCTCMVVNGSVRPG